MTNTFSSKLSIDALMMALMKCFHFKPNNQKCSGSYDMSHGTSLIDLQSKRS